MLMAKIKYEPTNQNKTTLDWEIAPIGTTSTAFRGTPHEWIERRDVHSREFYLLPSRSWNGGLIAIELRLLSKALMIRPRRIVIKRQVPVAPNMQMEEKANTQG